MNILMGFSLLCGLTFCSGETSSARSAQSGNGQQSETGKKSEVFMTSEISPTSLIELYNALNVTPKGKVAVKISTGEPGSNYLRPELIGNPVKSFDDVAIVECNTIYGRYRRTTADHYQVAKEHGFTAIADVDIMDAEGSMPLPVTGGFNMKENLVGTHFTNYDYFIVLSHFKGHSMAGFGGAIKNASIGIASADGKGRIHGSNFLEAMAEATKSVSDALGGNIIYINVMNRLSVDCDCEFDPAEPDMHDVGILASFDPVALDQACVDLVYAAEDGASLRKRIDTYSGDLRTLKHGEKIGLGQRSYHLINIDSKELTKNKELMKLLFVNGSPNKDGNTAAMAKVMLKGNEYETLNLIDYKIYPLGQHFDDDGFDTVLQKMGEADVIVMGSPVYWHSMTGQFRTLLDRIYESPAKRRLSGKDLYFLFQGAGPSSAMLEAGNYTMNTFCRLFGLHYKGMATSRNEAEKLGMQVK